jgi:hypothetical protein
MTNPYDLANLNEWASLGSRLRIHHEKHLNERRYPIWPSRPANGLKTASRNLDREILKIVDRSGKQLSPFGEPLRLNFGLNRWLLPQREEAYSDWLGWLFSQLRAIELLELLNIRRDDPVARVIAAHPMEHITVRREVVVEKGHEDATGRLDLELKITDSARVVIEVKKGSAVSSDTRKQSGYIESLRRKKIQFYPILLVTESEEKEKVDGFYVLLYSDFCLSLRCFVIKRIHDERGYIFLSFVLALAAALESNLINLGIFAGRPTSATVSHLNRFMERCNEKE